MMRIPRFASIFRVPSILSASLLFVVSGLVASDLPHVKRTSDYAALRCSNCSGVL